ncbi:MAG TPA: hypothetical protein V6C72_14415, partial [Chroococcales cyanobacterium]
MTANTASSIVRTVPALSIEQCERARLTVHELEPLWDEERHRLGPGISYYKPQHFYYASARQFNPIMLKHFGWLYDELIAVLARELGAPVKFRDDLALPGFNIYLGAIEFSRISYNVHVDLQYNDLSWEPAGSADFNKLLSFTLPVALPEEGGGLNVWACRRDDMHGEPNPLARKELSSDRALYHP